MPKRLPSSGGTFCVTLCASGSLYEKSVVKGFNSCLLLLIEAGKVFFCISEICHVEVKQRQTGSVLGNVHIPSTVLDDQVTCC